MLPIACTRHPKPDAPASPVPSSSRSAPTTAQPPVAPHAKLPATKIAKTKKDVPAEGLEAAQVGYYLDVLQGRLRQLADPNLPITRSGEKITLELTAHLHFAADNPQLPQADCDGMAPLVKVLVEYRMTRLTLKVNSEDSDAPKGKATKSRAAAIAKCLTRSGIAENRLIATGVAGQSHASTMLEVEAIVRGN
jgi:outer membrane protein OmpA-like peptidoglycan-associated protein